MKHIINYWDIELKIVGTYEEPEIEQGYQGGWLTEKVIHKGEDIKILLTEATIDEINQIVLNENY